MEKLIKNFQKVILEKEEINQELQFELKESKELVKDLFKQNKELHQRLEEGRIKLQQAHQEYKNLFFIDQTDYLNKHLLNFYQKFSKN